MYVTIAERWECDQCGKWLGRFVGDPKKLIDCPYCAASNSIHKREVSSPKELIRPEHKS